MTCSRRLLAALAAAAFLAAATIAQATSYARAPLMPAKALNERQVIARETGCSVLRGWFTNHLSVWKAGIKSGRDAEVDANNLPAMKQIVRRLRLLENEGWCGG